MRRKGLLKRLSVGWKDRILDFKCSLTQDFLDTPELCLAQQFCRSPSLQSLLQATFPSSIALRKSGHFNHFLPGQTEGKAPSGAQQGLAPTGVAAWGQRAWPVHSRQACETRGQISALPLSAANGTG